MKIDSLKKKRDALDAQIKDFAKVQKRKALVADLAYKAGILNLPDAILLADFKKLADENAGSQDA